jgi:hypothetical protein
MRVSTYLRAGGAAPDVDPENFRSLLDIIHNLLTGSLLIRRERVEGKIQVTGRQGK